MTVHTSSRQEVVGDKAKTHEHAGEVHVHDHWHVTHHHKSGPMGEFEHRSSYHQHEHNHAALVHAHDGRTVDAEKKEHDSQAHSHDHDAPTGRRDANK